MRLLLAIVLLLFALPASAQQGQGMSQALVVSSCGGGALPSGPLTQLTMDTTGRLCQSGIGSNVCSQATAYLARTTGGNEGGNAVNITALVCGLVSDGVITGDLLTGKCGSALDVLYVFAQQNQADALLNLCGTNYTAVFNGGTFTAYHGFSLLTAAISTNFNSTTATAPNYTQNSASFGYWLYSTPARDGNPAMGTNLSGTGASLIYDNFTDGNFYGRLNNAATGGVTSPGTNGSYVVDRPSSGSVIAYGNGVALGTHADASETPFNSVFTIGAIAPANNIPVRVYSEAHIGASLGATLNLALYNRLRTYMTAVGAP